MKKIAFILITSLFYQCGHAQISKDSLGKLNDYDLGTYYLKKGKEQTIIGCILLGVGITLTRVGVYQTGKDAISSSSGGVALSMIGILCGIASVPVALSARKNKHRAEILMYNQNIPLTNVSGTRLTSIGVAIPLRR